MNSTSTSESRKGQKYSLFPTIRPLVSKSESRTKFKDDTSTLTTPTHTPSSSPPSSPATSVTSPPTTYPTHPVGNSTAKPHFWPRRKASHLYSLPNSNIENYESDVASRSAVYTTSLRRVPRVTPLRSPVPPSAEPCSTDPTNLCETPPLSFPWHQDEENPVPSPAFSFVRNSTSGLSHRRGDDARSVSPSFSSSETLLDRSSSPGAFFDASDVEVPGTPASPETLAGKRSQTEIATKTHTPSLITIVEEGREWWGYGDAGVRGAARALGVAIPVKCHDVESEDEEDESDIAFRNGEGKLAGYVSSADGAIKKIVRQTSRSTSETAVEKKRRGLRTLLGRLGCGIL